MKQQSRIGIEHLDAHEAAIRAEERHHYQSEVSDSIELIQRGITQLLALLDVPQAPAKPVPRKHKLTAVTEEQVANVAELLVEWGHAYEKGAKPIDLKLGLSTKAKGACLRELVKRGRATVDSQGRYRIFAVDTIPAEQ